MACDSEDLRNFLCKEVVNNAGEKTPIDSLLQEGKYVGIYFSAHWCPPCRSFTPKLVEFYNKYKDSKNLEIIFVSSDREEAACKDYFGTMPWLHVPYSERETKVFFVLFFTTVSSEPTRTGHNSLNFRTVTIIL